MTQKTIACDFDGVVGQLLIPWLRRYNLDANDDLSVEQIEDWNIHQFVKNGFEKKIYEYIEDPSIYDEVPPIPGAIQGINTLKSLGYKVVFITHSTVGHVGRKKEWLEKYKLLDDKDMECYFEMEDKSEFPASYLLDDYIKNIATFKMGVGVLFSAPYNKSSIWNPRVNNWEDVIRYFLKEIQ